MIRSRVLTHVVVLSGLFVVLSLGARPAVASVGFAADQPRESVVVSGTGKVSGEPDMLTAEFGVESNGSTVDSALKRANAAAGRMRDSLVQAGVARADLQTSNVSISSKLNEHQEIVGYTVSQGLTVKIRNLARAGALMSAAAAAGGDAARLNGASFTIEDDAALLAEARKKAFADARGKAELYAREAGRPLGRVVSVSEGSPTYWGLAGQSAMAAADSRFSIEPGRQQLGVTVTVEWAFAASA